MQCVMKQSVFAVLLVLTSTPAIACKNQLRNFEIFDTKGRSLGQGQVREYKPAGRARPGRVLVLPTTNGENTIDRMYARSLCEKGFFSQLLVSWPETSYDFLDPRMHNDFFKRVRYAVKSLLGKDKRPVALVGTSLGGIAGSSLIAVEPRIKVAALIATGANVAQIISESNHPRARRQTKGSMKKYGLESATEFAEFLDSHITQDPSDLLPKASSLPETLHILTTKDNTVPTAHQEELIALFPRPTVIEIPSNHFLGILGAAKDHRHEIVDFLVSRMERLN